MPLRRIQRALAARGVSIHRRRSLSYGLDPMLDLGRLLHDVTTIVDVGANEGQTALAFARSFPDARVFALEPVPSTYSILTRRTSSAGNVRCFQVALGDREHETTIALAAKSGQNSLLNLAEPGPETLTLNVTTGERWAAIHEVTHIDVLKVDTEGYDLAVLAGFERFLLAGSVEAVLVECELARVRPEPHASFFELFDYLTARCFGFTTLYTDSVFARQFAWGNALFVRRPETAQKS